MRQISYEDTRPYFSFEHISLFEEKEREILNSMLKRTGTKTRREFISLYIKKDSTGLFQPSLPRFPDISGSFIKTDIKDPSKKFISLEEIGTNLDAAFHGHSMCNSKIRCVERDKICFREDYQSLTNKVKIISSGVGLWGDFVGKGMLTCMVLGTHGAPKSRVIYIALRELNKTADQGILAIIPNNYDDKLNWSIAIARAQRKGLKLDYFMFGDNAYEECTVDGRHSLAGIVICYKLAGAMSEEKYRLATIVERLRLMFISTISCHFTNTVKIGTDLAGKGGHSAQSLDSKDIVKEVVSYLLAPWRKYSICHEPGAEMVLLINSYDGQWKLCRVLAMLVLQRMCEMGHKCTRVYTGTIVLSTPGFSVTILPESGDEIIKWLDSYTTCLSWATGGTGNVSNYYINDLPVLPNCKGTHFNSKQASMLKRSVELAASNFQNLENYLNLNDPHGIYGTNMRKITNLLLEGVNSNRLLTEYPYILFSMIADYFEEIFDNIDGLMFALFSISIGQFFGERTRSSRKITEKLWQRALQRSVKSVAAYFKVCPRDRTLLDIFGSLYMIMVSSRLDMLTDLHLALEVGAEQCRKIKHAKTRNIIDSPYATMRTAHSILDAVAAMLREANSVNLRISAKDIDTTPTAFAEKIKELLTM